MRAQVIVKTEEKQVDKHFGIGLTSTIIPAGLLYFLLMISISYNFNNDFTFFLACFVFGNIAALGLGCTGIAKASMLRKQNIKAPTQLALSIVGVSLSSVVLFYTITFMCIALSVSG